MPAFCSSFLVLFGNSQSYFFFSVEAAAAMSELKGMKRTKEILKSNLKRNAEKHEQRDKVECVTVVVELNFIDIFCIYRVLTEMRK